MHESLSKFLNLLLALLFFVYSSSLALELDAKINSLIAHRENSNYLPSELSLKYSGEASGEVRSEMKDRMLLASLCLEKSRADEEDFIVEIYGRTFNLAVKDETQVDVRDESGKELKARDLMILLGSGRNLKVKSFYENFELTKLLVEED
ncbi:MAG: hypothetical protein Q4A72_06940 [Bacillota bacterium]|nr:hypothetical protein [Bacillota bacterium]